jgi:hypothetical protein
MTPHILSPLRGGGLGAAVLLAISFWNLQSAWVERRHRERVLADGREAQAVVRGAFGAQAVTIEWTDDKGRKRIAEASTGKPFARSMNQAVKPDGGGVAIKYLDDSTPPVILQQAGERERVNTWWIGTSAGMAILSALIFVATFVASRFRGKSQ